MKMFHILLHGNIPYLEEGLQGRVKAYSIFSGEDIDYIIEAGVQPVYTFNPPDLKTWGSRPNCTATA